MVEEIKKANLYNLSNGKTKRTINYINRLPFDDLSKEEFTRFKKIKKNALSKFTANEMLDVIGFNPTGIDNIYEMVIR